MFYFYFVCFGHRWPFLRKMSCEIHAWSSRALQESFTDEITAWAIREKHRVKGVWHRERRGDTHAMSFRDTVSVRPLAAPFCKQSFFLPFGPSAPPCKDPSGESTWRPAPRHSWAALWLDCAGTEPAPYSRSRDRCALQTDKTWDMNSKLKRERNIPGLYSKVLNCETLVRTAKLTEKKKFFPRKSHSYLY